MCSLMLHVLIALSCPAWSSDLAAIEAHTEQVGSVWHFQESLIRQDGCILDISEK